jgi:D-alanyl-D-alanine dipeptidase
MSSSLLAPIPPLSPVATGARVRCRDVAEPMVDLSEFSAGVIAFTPENSDVVPARCLSRITVARKLLLAASELPIGLRLAILDAWRPVQVQRELFDSHLRNVRQLNPGLPERKTLEVAARYVANPDEAVAPHTTGGAVDLMLLDDCGRPMWFGSHHDEFSEKSATRYYEELILSGTPLGDNDRIALHNRRVLFNTLAGLGFTNYPEEWWHFDYGDSFWSQVTGKVALYDAVHDPVVA